MIRGNLRRFLRRIVLGRPLSDEEAMLQRIQRLRDKGATIGANVRLIGRIDGLNPHLVTIGSHCVVGQRSALLTHCPIRGAKPVVVEDEVWIGFNVVVLPGVRVGTQSIIGAGAVVTKDVPPRSVAVGNPARVIRSLTAQEAYELSAGLRQGTHIGEDPEYPVAEREI